MNIPEELKQRPQWLVWRFIQKPDQKKPSKMPYYVDGELRHGEQGSPDDRARLVHFDTAIERMALSNYDGVGFAFLPGDGLIGIDLDAVLSTERQSTIVQACQTFAEVSPSGTGVHIIGLGTCETFKSNDVGIEVFCGRQFFTVTGKHVPTSPMALQPIPLDAIDKLRRTVEQAKEARRAAKSPAPAPAGPTTAPSTRYCMAALESSVQRLRSAVEGGRNDLLNGEAYGLAQLIHTGGISEATIRAALQEAAEACGLPPGEAAATISSGLRAGQQHPRALPEREPHQSPRQPRQRIDPETGEILPDAPPPPANDNHPKPLDIFSEFPAPPIQADMLPDVIADYSIDCGQLIGVDPALVAIPALVACAAALHDDIKIQPKRHETGWRESARLWCAVVGQPSVRKTPAIMRGTSRLRHIDADLARENQRQAADYADQLEQHKEAKKEARKTGGTLPTPERPPMRRMIVEDITVEALSEVLKDNARGVLCIQDELSGWFGSMDAYSGGKAGNKDRAAWLQAYNGGFRQVDRVMRGSVHIPNFSVSMIGGIQPDAIRRIAKDMTDDGLMQRFMVVIGRNAVEHDRPENAQAKRRYQELVDHLHAVQPGDGVVKLSEEAHEIRTSLMAYAAELADYPALPGGLRSHLGKWSGLFARLLLVYHAIECCGRRVHPVMEPVWISCAQRVDKLMRRYLLPHAIAYYTDILGASGDLEHARWIGGYILSKRLDVVTNRDLVQAYKQWRGMDDWRRQRVMMYLEDAGWIVPADDERPSKRGATAWSVNANVHHVFEVLARDEAERRDRVRAEIAGMAKAARA